MSATKPNTTRREKGQRQQKLQDVGPELALDMLRSAIAYLQLAGVPVTYGNEATGLRLQLEAVHFSLPEKRFVLQQQSEQKPHVPPVPLIGGTVGNVG